jgi:hypothetical protein
MDPNIVSIKIVHEGAVSVEEGGKVIKIEMDGRKTIFINLSDGKGVRYKFHDLIRLLELIEIGAAR